MQQSGQVALGFYRRVRGVHAEGAEANPINRYPILRPLRKTLRPQR